MKNTKERVNIIVGVSECAKLKQFSLESVIYI